VHPRHRVHDQPRLGHAAAPDLVALLRRRHVLEQQGEPAILAVGGEVALGERAADPRRELLVEADLALVDAHADTGPAAGGIRRRHLHHDAVGPGVVDTVVGKRDPVRLTHLAGADRLDGERGDLRGEDARKPCGVELVGGADDACRLEGHGAILSRWRCRA
jgi:hypothetical protein